MNESQLPKDQEPTGPAPIDNGTDRRSFLRSIAGLGIFAVGGASIGQSLLLRIVSAQPLLMPGVPTTLTASRSSSHTEAGTIPDTISFSGVQTPAEAPGTFTRTAGVDTQATYSQTLVWPAPDGKTQPVTLAGTYLMSFTPPATNTQTVSWKGNSYTITNVRSPSYFTVTVTNSQTVSYTSTTLNDKDPAPLQPEPLLVPQESRDGVVVDQVDVEGADLFDPHARYGGAHFLRFACGV